MTLRILQWNLNGYYNNYNELRLLQHNNSPQIISLQETHLKENPTNSYIAKNYSFYGKHSLASKHGVALIVSKNIPHKIINLISNFDAIAIEITSQIPFILINIYIPPTKQFTLQDLNTIIPQTSKPVVITGDFNAWSPLWGSKSYNKRGKIVSEFIESNDLILLNNSQPTHFSTHRTFTNIDITLCSPELYTFSKWHVFDSLHGSDHFPIEIELFHKPQKTTKNRTIFKTDQADWSKFQSLGTKYIKLDETNNNTNCLAARFHKGIIKCANESMPKSSGNYSKKPICWWNATLNSLRLDKKEKWKTFKREQTISSLIDYKRSNARFKRESRISKRTSFIEYTRDINPNTPIKILWDKVRALKGNPLPNTIKYLKLPNNIVLDQTIDIANALGNSWSAYSSNCNFSETYQENKSIVQNNIDISYNLSKRAKCIEKEITLIELQACLSSLHGKTPGYDQITYTMLKNLENSDKLKLCQLYNKILNSSVIPFQWKNAIVIPIVKPNKPIDSIAAYRPISLLSCISKLLDKIISRRLFWFLTQENKLTQHQTAYKTESGTINALIYLDDYITKSLSTSSHVSLLSIDAEKAFDRVGLHTVIQQLMKWKTGPIILNYVKSFLSNRRFKVRLNNIQSDTFNLENGIPQGSPLSVILFLVAFNQLSIIINECKYFKHTLYADDLYIFRVIQSLDIFNTKLNLLYYKITEWCNYSGVKISEEKCKHLHFCKKINCNNINLSLNAFRLENVNDLKILGLIFNKRYLWNSHINNLCNSLNKRLNVLKCLSSINLEPNTTSLININKATILSKIDYGLTIYGETSKENIRKISSIYNAAIRMSLGAFRTTPIKNMLAESNMLAIPIRKEYLLGRLLPKLLNPKKSALNEIVNNAISRKRKPKRKSCIFRTLEYAQNNNLNTKYPKIPNQNNPPWFLKSSAIDMSLSTWKKSETPPEVYYSYYLDVIEKHKDWQQIFTDGSKTENGTGYSIIKMTNSNSTIIQSTLLPPHSSVFTAEAEAILDACRYAKLNKAKHIILTDSLSTLSAVKNINSNNPTTNQIRDILIDNMNIKLIWIPSHIGIQGNEKADEIAKLSTKSPLIAKNIFCSNDIKNYLSSAHNHLQQLDWNSYNHFYKNYNPNKDKQIFPQEISRRETIAFSRFRMGHTRLTHKIYFDSSGPSQCIFCNCSDLNIKHIVEECPETYRICQHLGIQSLDNLIKSYSPENIKDLAKFLRYSNIFFEI